MRSTPDQDERLRARLKEAVEQFAGGSADAFGRLLGYTNGGYIRESLNSSKPVRTAIIDRTHKVQGLEGWFDAELSAASLADVGASQYSLSADERAMIDAARSDPRLGLLAANYRALNVERRRVVFAMAEALNGPGGAVLLQLFSQLGSEIQPSPVPAPATGKSVG